LGWKRKNPWRSAEKKGQTNREEKENKRDKKIVD